MIKINTFKCGLCNKFIGTRKGLREHLKLEHFIKREITNFKGELGKRIKQNFWIKE
jgi:hypothetical protein